MQSSTRTPPCVVAVAGTDPSGGAGIQADIKAISATGSYAASIVTALVSQNTQGVQAIHAIPPSFVKEQFHSVFQDLTVDAVKVGMLHDEPIIEAVVQGIKQYHSKNVVFDPVMVAKSGCPLLAPHTIEYLKSAMLPLCRVLTPNVPEAEVLLARSIHSSSEMEIAAAELGDRYGIAVLLKGGHMSSLQASDVLYCPETGRHHWFYAERVMTKNTHGTGCSLSSAIASYLAQSNALIEAIEKAKIYISQAINSASQWHIGQGQGPIDHFYFLRDHDAV